MGDYVVELAGGNHAKAVYEVLDKTRHPNQRVMCRASFQDATKIAAALHVYDKSQVRTDGP